MSTKYTHLLFIKNLCAFVTFVVVIASTPQPDISVPNERGIKYDTADHPLYWLIIKLFKEWRKHGLKTSEIIPAIAHESEISEHLVQEMIVHNYGFLP